MQDLRVQTFVEVRQESEQCRCSQMALYLLSSFSLCFHFSSPRSTKLYRINRERQRFLGNKAENQQHFDAFAAPSSGQIWQIYKMRFNIFAKFDHQMGRQMQQKCQFFWLHPPPTSLEAYSLLYLYLCSSVPQRQTKFPHCSSQNFSLMLPQE